MDNSYEIDFQFVEQSERQNKLVKMIGYRGNSNTMRLRPQGET